MLDKETQESSPITDGRVGRFILFDRTIETTPYSTLNQIMSNFFVVRAEMMYAQRGIEYTAYSPLFGITDRGEQIPEYVLKISTNPDEPLKVSAELC